MAIVKLVCQGCGANLDALDNQRVLQCGYCGTTNQIKQTVHEPAPAPAPAAPPSPTPSYAPPVPSYAPPQISPHQMHHAQASRGRGMGVFVAMTAILPLVIGGVVAYTAFSKSSQILEQIEAGGFAGAADARKFRWESDKPFVADVDGDGREDLIGLIQEVGAQDLRLAAMSGDGWASLWEVSLGDPSAMPGQVQLYFDPGSKLALFPRGAALTAYAADTGEQRWVSNLSDGIEGIVVDGDTLRVTTIDDKTTSLRLADGKPVAEPNAEPSPEAVTLRDDEGYSLIPDLRSLDLDSDQFDDLRIEQAFCPDANVVADDRRPHEKRCSYAHGLAWASRSSGTRVPFMVGYDPETKAERWRMQLTAPGSLTTVETGFSQPRAELLGDSAVLGFQPDGGPLTLRRISLVDGSSSWEATIEAERGGAQLVGMVPSGDRLYVNYRWAIYVFDLETGERQAELGGW